MQMTGNLFWTTGSEHTAVVKEAVVTAKRISIDWIEGNRVGHLEADSHDGEHFSGYYGYPEPSSGKQFKLTLFRSKSEALLIGSWHEHETGDEGTWYFRLSTDGSAKESRHAGV